MVGACGTHGRQEMCIQVLFGRPDGKRPFRRRSRRWEQLIKTDVQEAEWEIIDFIDVSQDTDRWRALVNEAMNSRVA
jgi:hypothetical protein